MIFRTNLALALALMPTTLLAAPTKTVEAIIVDIAARGLPAAVVHALEDGKCDLDSVQMPIAPTPLPPPSSGLKLSHVAVGRGTQNYSCTPNSPASTPVAVGATASLFNATCSAVRAPAVLADVTKHALEFAVPTSEVAQRLLSGHHEFNESGSPFFTLGSDATRWGWVNCKKNGTSNAPDDAAKGPNGLGSVPWLKLSGVDGDYKEIYRLNTAGGVAPKTCGSIQGNFTVEYAAEYWFFK
ncbi:hypothetical protein EJ04DRAFT_507786 [Polyplosphaeria fusca]|uniref:Malate dehydrogenase n=1 Tax=Polyplosphaeria fusca TaxID=682080 RepID=A0A9P4V5K7_9PLEO|nr:hypothetical protein EJ04DRAFT_507786 [Polyplosphaeria fusca]